MDGSNRYAATPTGHQHQQHQHQNGSSPRTVQMRNKSNNNKPSMNGDTGRCSNTSILQLPDRSSYQVYIGGAGVGAGALIGGAGEEAGARSSMGTGAGAVAAGTGGGQAGDGARVARRYSREDQCDCDSTGCGPLLANNLAYFGATAWFIPTVNVKFLPDAPFPVIGNMLPTSLWMLSEETAAIVPLLLWAIHFIRRFTEVLFVHKYTRRTSYVEAVGASVYYWGFGFWIGYSANFHLGRMKYYSPTLWLLLPGILLFIIGEVGNCAVHVALRRMHQKRNRHPLLVSQQRRECVLPTGSLFRLVSCPNYTFEIVSWVGYGLAVFTLPALLFLIATVVTLVVYAHKKHAAYKELFNGDDGKELYPVNRKALIPFVF